MKEQVGKCTICQKPIYCLGGFLDGKLSDEGSLCCFFCSKQEDTENNHNN
ncbi:MAG: hypothetical protein WBV93_17760 [Anaerobacillus sp.]